MISSSKYLTAITSLNALSKLSSLIKTILLLPLRGNKNVTIYVFIIIPPFLISVSFVNHILSQLTKNVKSDYLTYCQTI